MLIVVYKRDTMGMLLTFKDRYVEAFDNCKPDFVVILLKLYSVFSALMIFMAIYALCYRAFTGFEF